MRLFMALLTSSQQQMPLKNSFGKFDLQYGSIYIGLSICIILTGFFLCVAPSPAPFTWQCETTSSGRAGRSSPVLRYCCDRIISDITFQPSHTYQDTDKQVKDTPFPSITICTEGINMDAIMESVTRDFNDWLKMKKNVTTGDDSYTKEKHDDNVKEFLSDLFNISPSYNISIGDIALAYTSPDPDR